MTSQQKHNSLGFTLVELLVVIFIISIVTSVALLSFSRNKNKDIESYTHQMIQVLTLAEEQAMLQPTDLGFSLQEASLQFSRYSANEWAPWNDALLSVGHAPENIQLVLKVGTQGQGTKKKEANDSTPQIVISSNGDITPFTLYVGEKDSKPRFVITGDVDGNITSKELT